MFKFKIDKKYFLENKEFHFDNFCFYIFAEMIDKFTILKTKQINWAEIKQNQEYHFHEIKDSELTKLINCFDVDIQNHLSIYQMSITKQERVFFYIINDVCFPIGYDKYHFLYFVQNENIEFRINKLKHYIYNIFNSLLSNSEAEKETDLFINEVENGNKSNIFKIKPKLFSKQIKLKLNKYKDFFIKLFKKNYDKIETKTNVFFKELNKK